MIKTTETNKGYIVEGIDAPKIVLVKYNENDLKHVFLPKKENIKHLGGNDFFIPNK